MLIFQVEWLQKKPAICFNPLQDWEAWVKSLLKWLDSESNLSSEDEGSATTTADIGTTKMHTKGRRKNRDSTVCMVDFLRGSGSGTPLAGLGAYSSDEILFLSAISPFLHAQDALNCPSRLARLCEAIFQLVSTNQIE
jgi:hypothetical protein